MSKKKVPAKVVDNVVTTLKRGLSIADAAAYLGVTSSFIRHSIYSGELPSAYLGKRLILDIKDLDALLEREKQTRSIADSEAAA